jgi:hypothetical protein
VARLDFVLCGLGGLCVLPTGHEPSGASPLNKDQIAERGARMARRDDRTYREYVREEQRSQPGCPCTIDHLLHEKT